MLKDYLYIIGCIILILFIIGWPLTLTIMEYVDEKEIEITIQDKYIKGNNGKEQYLIVDTNNNTYVIHDLFFKGKFNSTDLYNKIKINKTYKVKTSGFRWQFQSMYPNINELLEEE